MSMKSGLVVASILCAMVPATGASAKDRVVRSAPSSIPPPAYGVRADGRAHANNPAHDVYVAGVYRGSDPDPRIRASIANGTDMPGIY